MLKNLKQYQLTALKHTYQLRSLAITLRMRTTISPGQWQLWTAVSPLPGESSQRPAVDKQTRCQNKPVCRLQATGYPPRAYFSYPTYYAIDEPIHGSLEEPTT